MSAEDDGHSSSDDSICEHGYPLHDDPPSVDRLSDKAVIVIQDDNDGVFEHMFLVPFMRGESPLNEAIKQMLALDYHSHQRNGGERIENVGVSDCNNLSYSNHYRHRNNLHASFTMGLERPVAVMTAKQAAPSIDDDDDDDDKPLAFLKAKQLARRLKDLNKNQTKAQMGEIGVYSKQGNGKGNVGKVDTDMNSQINDYGKPLTELSSVTDASILDSNVDYSGEETRHKCLLCGWGFSTESDLTNHQRLHTGERPYQCEFCIGNFQDKTALLNHRRQHTGEKPFRCEICGTAFSQKHSLVVHKNVHTGEKRYKCDLCDSCFVCRSNLNVHMRIHTGSKPYTCEYCQSSYAQKSQLTVHKRMHTGEKPYKCQLCPAAFAVRGHLIHHIRVHTGEKPFKCEECGSAFTKRCSLRVHMRAHTGEKPYRCQFCDQAFHLKNMLTKHLLNFHRIAKKMPTPPQKEGDPPPSPLQGLDSSLVSRGSDIRTNVPVIPHTTLNLQNRSKSRNNSQGPGSSGDLSTSGKAKGPKTHSKTHNTNTDVSGNSLPSRQKTRTSSKGSLTPKLETPSVSREEGKQQTPSKRKPRPTRTANQRENMESHSDTATKSTSKNTSSYVVPESSEEFGTNGQEGEAFKCETQVTATHITITAAGGMRRSKRVSDSNSKINKLVLDEPSVDSKMKMKTSVKPHQNTSASGITDGEHIFNTNGSNKSRKYISINNLSTPNNYNSFVPGLDIQGHSNTGDNHSCHISTRNSCIADRFSQNALIRKESGSQSSPEAQQMLDHFKQSVPTAAMKSMMETYSGGMPGTRVPAMAEEYRQLYSSVLGNSSTTGLLGQRLSGTPGPVSQRFSDGPCS